ncbi:hypothetical protein FRB93_002963 [Tulasnella sp. JGI-2019a]|nr:hypothetical protein FRB93_002963 [Tulasnella sp. JGI-2019a]
MQTSHFAPPSLPSEIIFLILRNLADSNRRQQYLKCVAVSGSALRDEAERLMYKSIRLTNGGQVDALFEALTTGIRSHARVGYVKTLRITDKSPYKSIKLKVPVLRSLLAMLPNLLDLQVKALGHHQKSMKALTEGVVCHAKLQGLALRGMPYNIVAYFSGQHSLTRLTLGYSISPSVVLGGL